VEAVYSLSKKVMEAKLLQSCNTVIFSSISNKITSWRIEKEITRVVEICRTTSTRPKLGEAEARLREDNNESYLPPPRNIQPLYLEIYLSSIQVVRSLAKKLTTENRTNNNNTKVFWQRKQKN
jgi:hypothetical protein